MENVNRIFLGLLILVLSSSRCVAQFVTCFNGAFVPCVNNKKCKGLSTVQLTIANCSKVATAATVRACTSKGFSKCANVTGAKSTFSCNRAVSNYLFNTTIVREKNACLAMKPPCQELMACDACGSSNCIILPPTNKPTASPVSPPSKAPTRMPTLQPVKPPTKTPTAAPVKPPTKSPTKKPTAAPVKPPTAAPVKPPTAAPVKPPTKSPTKKPTAAPVKPPTAAPVKPPTAAPVKPPTKLPTKAPTPAPVKSPTKSPTKKPTASPLNAPTKAPAPKPTRKPTKAPTKSPLTVVADTLPPGDISTCTSADCQQKATCCVNNGGTLITGGCINCLPTTYGGFYRCGFCDASAFPGNKETCASFSVGSEWLRCEMPSGDICNVQFCSWTNLPNISDCTATC